MQTGRRLAPGMGLNALFAYTIVGDMGYPATALGAVFIAGVLFVIISTTRIRAWIIMSIPDDLKIGMTAGVGFFIGHYWTLGTARSLPTIRLRSLWAIWVGYPRRLQHSVSSRCYFIRTLSSGRADSASSLSLYCWYPIG